jgi:hypothetical protein
MMGDEKESHGADLPRFGWRTNPLPASLGFVHPQAPVWEMLDDDVITNCHCQLGMAKRSAAKNAVFILAL